MPLNSQSAHWNDRGKYQDFYPEYRLAVDDAVAIANGQIDPTQMRLWCQLQYIDVRVRPRQHAMYKGSKAKGNGSIPMHSSPEVRERKMATVESGRVLWTMQFYGNAGRVGRGSTSRIVTLWPPLAREVMRPFGRARAVKAGSSFVRPGSLHSRYRDRPDGRCMCIIFGSLTNNSGLTIYEARLDKCHWVANIWATMLKLHDTATAL